MLIIPAIDIIENKIVRLVKGDFNNVTVYQNSPLEQAMLYDSLGFQWLHLIDLNGSKDGKLNITQIIKEIKYNTGLKIECGGGIRTLDDVQILFDSGVDKVITGSLPLSNKAEFKKILNTVSPEKIIIAADILDFKIIIKGWTENSNIHIYDFVAECKSYGLNEFLCTDISKDGMLTGTNIALYKSLIEKFPKTNFIASGGIKDIEDVKNVLAEKVYGVIVGKAIYENKIDLKELAKIGK